MKSFENLKITPYTKFQASLTDMHKFVEYLKFYSYLFYLPTLVKNARVDRSTETYGL